MRSLTNPTSLPTVATGLAVTAPRLRPLVGELWGCAGDAARAKAACGGCGGAGAQLAAPALPAAEAAVVHPWQLVAPTWSVSSKSP